MAGSYIADRPEKPALVEADALLVGDSTVTGEGSGKKHHAKQSATASSVALRTPTGQLKAADGVDDDDLVTVSQFDFAIIDGLRRSVEMASGGLQTVMYDDLGQPSLMNIIPKFRYEDLGFDAQLGTGIHEAFLKGGVEKDYFMYGTYIAAIQNGRAISMPRLDSANTINFDNAKASCTAKGAGWHMGTNWEWSANELWCIANGHEPLIKGNTYYGRSHANPEQFGIRQDGGLVGDVAGDARTMTGSGPNEWAHNLGSNGIRDLIGNVWEWADGAKIVDGRLFICADNDYEADESTWIDTGIDIVDTSVMFNSMATVGNQQSNRAMITHDQIDASGRFYANLAGERMPIRGGSWSNGSNAGLGALYFSYARTNSSTTIGFRVAFMPAS